MSSITNRIQETVPSRQTKRLGRLNVFATSPQSLGSDRAAYVKQVARVAQWSEKAGCAGTLIYTDNSIVDPWLVAQIVIENTNHLCPLVAVQPIYMHPYTVAKMITSLGFLHNRRVCLNMVAGGFTNDLIALNDRTPHDKRYDRLIEYTKIIQLLLSSEMPVSFAGEFYAIDKLALKPPLPRDLLPGIFVSGSSPAGLAAARSIGAIAVKYPEAPSQCTPASSDICGVRVGIIARPNESDAWEVAYQRFPEDRKGQLTHALAMRVSDSSWHRQLSEVGKATEHHETYWLGPFMNSKSNCPYLVGTYQDVATELTRYIRAGYRTFILDIPPCEEELYHTGLVFERAVSREVDTIQ